MLEFIDIIDIENNSKVYKKEIEILFVRLIQNQFNFSMICEILRRSEFSIETYLHKLINKAKIN